jgi:hypothetical protein
MTPKLAESSRQAFAQYLRATPDEALLTAVQVRRAARKQLAGLGDLPPPPERSALGDDVVARINGIINVVISLAVGLLCEYGASALTVIIVAASKGTLAPISWLINAAIAGLCVGIAGEAIAELIRAYFAWFFPDYKVKELIQNIWEGAYQRKIPEATLDAIFKRVDGEDIVSVAGIYIVTTGPDYDPVYAEDIKAWQESVFDETSRQYSEEIAAYPSSFVSIIGLRNLERTIQNTPNDRIRPSDKLTLTEQIRQKIVDGVAERDALEAARRINEAKVRKVIRDNAKLRPAEREANRTKTTIIVGASITALAVYLLRSKKA